MNDELLTFRGAAVWSRGRLVRRDLHLGTTILAGPPSGALKIDLEGCILRPGRVNAHDHLELNHYPRSKFLDCYPNAHLWGEDMNARLDHEPYRSLKAYPLEDRCFIGGLKNLLSGVTTVAHHNPPHRCLFRQDFPVRVLKNYGWAHSLRFTAEADILHSYRATPPSQPWFIHLAEGTDQLAASEYSRLKSLGCVGPNTVLIHGVGLTPQDIADAAPKVRGLVICPTTNAYLLGQYPPVAEWIAAGGKYALGSDSRLTADGTLLDEEAALNRLFSQGDASCPPSSESHILGDPRLAHLEPGAYADVIVSEGTDVKLVIRAGVPQFGDPDLMAKFPAIQVVAARLFGKPKSIHIDLARRIHRCPLKEPGLEVDALPSRSFAWFHR